MMMSGAIRSKAAGIDSGFDKSKASRVVGMIEP
jgi:hypothetical protein